MQAQKHIGSSSRRFTADAYFVMPSLSALRWIGNLAETSSIEQKER